MKQMYFILAMLSVVSISALAKDDASNVTTGVGGGGGGFPHFTPQADNSGAGVVQSYRMTGRTNARFDGSYFKPVDSTSYAYGIGRGGNLDLDNISSDESILFDESYTYIYDQVLNMYGNRLYRHQAFDAMNSVTSLTYSFWHTSTSTWKDSARYLYSYVPGTNKMDGSVLQISQGGTMWVAHDQSSLQYNGNNVISVSSHSYDAMFTYDANNNITSIEDEVFDHGTGKLNKNQHKAYTYNSNNEVTTYTLQNWDLTSQNWVNTKYWEYTYANGQLVSSLEYNWNGTWKLAAKHTFTYRAAGGKESEIVQLWDEGAQKFINFTNEVWDYNYQGQVATITVSSWDNGSGTWAYATNNSQIRFYYEYYSPTGIKKGDGGQLNVQVYPVPAVSTIHVNAQLEKPQEFTIAIFNMAGQQILSTSGAASTTFNQDINVAQLPSGNYVLKVSAGADQFIRNIQINR